MGHKKGYYADYRPGHRTELNRASREYQLRRKYAALQVVQAGGWGAATGEEVPRCSGCGCDDWELLEFNHRDGNGYAEGRANGDRNSRLEARIWAGTRGVEDLDLRCRPCNALEYLTRKFPGRAYPRVVWEGASLG